MQTIYGKTLATTLATKAGEYMVALECQLIKIRGF